ncbi:MAG: hypothetical protein PHU51_03885 [Candidatus Nanoarchaeia archaeon]|jgi:hypothetical protein|nr:hypothetical protein [Candidatus Nanoarchaeia archaeon]
MTALISLESILKVTKRINCWTKQDCYQEANTTKHTISYSGDLFNDLKLRVEEVSESKAEPKYTVRVLARDISIVSFYLGKDKTIKNLYHYVARKYAAQHKNITVEEIEKSAEELKNHLDSIK